MGAIRSFGNVLAYVSDFAGHWGGVGEDGWRTNAMFDNKVVFFVIGSSYHDCTWTGSLSFSNALYGAPAVGGTQCPAGKAMTLAEWQALDPAHNDVGSSLNATMPLGWEIVAWGRQLVGM